MRKKRPCGMPTRVGCALCGAHLSKLRCPSCTTALPSERALSKHLPICPAARRIRKEREQPWCVPACNIYRQSVSYKQTLYSKSPLQLDEIEHVMKTVQRLLSTGKDSLAPPWVPTLPVQRSFLLEEDADIAAEWADSRNSQMKLEPKHFAQFGPLAASLLHHPPTDKLAVLELGAGRAYTSLYVAHVLHKRGLPASFVAVDRAGGRHKADRTIRNWVDNADSPLRTFRRIKCDVADFRIREVDEIRTATDVRLIGKHVCGAALDASLNAATNFAREERKGAGEVRLIFACCCRRLCRWDWLGEAQKIWLDWGVDDKFYEVICRLAQWGLDQKQAQEYAEIGKKCRLLLDMGRVRWLRRQGWDAYCGEYTTASPENRCIAAVWRGV
ncbi:unnamed protein product [Chondrus crispus]|uniref:tRNA:m(4)X modification enzyme TRM13 n=1 Tax=Chondrus crispus TaxID=2769 RepID=R7QPM9_CHOCR|nr:unnamed protein product [Chondrus crispus]CDF39350.1 unnamed protein product [Chondrus crispus]|eukprot:XP_005719261.1 unnamed protein product [Chondrus crispus]